MKVVAINGSPKANGNTAMALKTVGAELTAQGIDFEILQVGGKSMRGCVGCGGCANNKDQKCVFGDDVVNEYIQIMKEADGILLGSPVYFADMSGTLKCFLDRVFYVSGANGNLFRHKVGASVAAVRRAGGVPALDQMNKYILYAEMIMPGSTYWNILYGRVPGDGSQDGEGLQTMRSLGQNMAWIMKLIEKGKADAPAKLDKVSTSFVR